MKVLKDILSDIERLQHLRDQSHPGSAAWLQADEGLGVLFKRLADTAEGTT